jgi:GH24 family phage-related lysozyme (muramidase)
VNKNVSNAKYLSQSQSDALVSASYNMGVAGFSKSKIKKVVESFGDKISSPHLTLTDDFKQKIADAFVYHTPASGPTKKGLTERRFNEYEMFTTGDYRRDPGPNKWVKGKLP